MMLPSAIDAIACVLAIPVLYALLRRPTMSQYEYGEDELDQPRFKQPHPPPAWTQQQAEGFRLEAESLRWIVDGQSAELLRMYSASADDAETIRALNDQVDGLSRALNDERRTVESGERRIA